jgi:hypothetical protein
VSSAERSEDTESAKAIEDYERESDKYSSYHKDLLDLGSPRPNEGEGFRGEGASRRLDATPRTRRWKWSVRPKCSTVSRGRGTAASPAGQSLRAC